MNFNVRGDLLIDHDGIAAPASLDLKADTNEGGMTLPGFGDYTVIDIYPGHLSADFQISPSGCETLAREAEEPKS